MTVVILIDITAQPRMLNQLLGLRWSAFDMQMFCCRFPGFCAVQHGTRIHSDLRGSAQTHHKLGHLCRCRSSIRSSLLGHV
jgi:hypothetical protein